MEFVIKLPTTFRKNKAIWVIMGLLTKIAHFILIRTDFPLSKLSKLYIREVIKLQGVPSASYQIGIHGLLPTFG